MEAEVTAEVTAAASAAVMAEVSAVATEAVTASVPEARAGEDFSRSFGGRAFITEGDASEALRGCSCFPSC